jgi:sugar-phosphatase
VFPAALLFDLDGTLVDSERESAEAMARVLARTPGIVITQADRDYVIGRSWVAIYNRMCELYPAIEMTRDELIAAVAVVREDVFAESGITILPGAQALLARTAGVKRALVTGSSRAEAAQALKHLGEHARFDVVMAAEDVVRSKPDPIGYLQAAQALGVDPADCVVLEDSQAGIAAGRAAGCTVIAITAGNFAQWDQSAADHIVATLDEVTPDWLASCKRSGIHARTGL